MKFRVHPLFFAYVLAVTLFGGVKGFAAAFLAVTLHEICHYAVAKMLGYKELCLTLMPYGAVLKTGEWERHAAMVLAAGPLCNFFIAVCLLALFWLVPETYGYLQGFCRLNVVLAVVNLLPVYPLDGGRLLEVLFPEGAVPALCRVGTLIVGVCCVALCFTSYGNFSILLFGLFLTGYFCTFNIKKSHKVKCHGGTKVYSLVKIDAFGRVLPVKVYVKGKCVKRFSPKQVADIVTATPPCTPLRTCLATRTCE